MTDSNNVANVPSEYKLAWSVLSVLLSVIQFAWAAVILAWLRRSYRIALDRRKPQEQVPSRPGPRNNRDMLILPIYYHFLKVEAVHCVLWVLVIASLLADGESLAGDANDDADAHDPDRLPWAISLGLLMGIGAALQEGVQFFLVQVGAGRKQLRMTYAFSIVWGAFAGIASAVVSYLGHGNRDYPALENPLLGAFFVRVTLMFLFNFACVCLSVCTHAITTNRPSWRPLALYHIVLSLCALSFMLLQNLDDSSMQPFWQTLLLAAFSTLFLTYVPMLYHSLIRDSRFWRALGVPDDFSQWVDPSPIQPLLAQGVNTRGGRFTQGIMIDFSQLEYHRKIGSGFGGAVFAGSWYGQPVAIKDLHVMELTEELVENFCREAELLKNMEHPNIVGFLGVCIAPPSFAIVTQLCIERTLLDELEEWRKGTKPPISESRILVIAISVARALAYLHTSSVLHRDLKPSNILFDDKGVVKVADFGLALRERDIVRTSVSVSKTPRDLTPSESFNSMAGEQKKGVAHALTGDGKQRDGSKQNSRGQNAPGDPGLGVGTLPYMAPELIGTKPFVTKAADVYAFGVILWELTTGLVPERRGRINTEETHMRSLHHYESYKLLIATCCATKVKARPSFEQVLATLNPLHPKSRKQAGLAMSPSTNKSALSAAAADELDRESKFTLDPLRPSEAITIGSGGLIGPNGPASAHQAGQNGGQQQQGQQHDQNFAHSPLLLNAGSVLFSPVPGPGPQYARAPHQGPPVPAHTRAMLLAQATDSDIQEQENEEDDDDDVVNSRSSTVSRSSNRSTNQQQRQQQQPPQQGAGVVQQDLRHDDLDDESLSHPHSLDHREEPGQAVRVAFLSKTHMDSAAPSAANSVVSAPDFSLTPVHFNAGAHLPGHSLGTSFEPVLNTPSMANALRMKQQTLPPSTPVSPAQMRPASPNGQQPAPQQPQSTVLLASSPPSH